MESYWYFADFYVVIFSYIESEGITDFPRGVFLAYGDYLTTGFKTKEKAIEYSKTGDPFLAIILLSLSSLSSWWISSSPIK